MIIVKSKTLMIYLRLYRQGIQYSGILEAIAGIILIINVLTILEKLNLVQTSVLKSKD